MGDSLSAIANRDWHRPPEIWAKGVSDEMNERQSLSLRLALEPKPQHAFPSLSGPRTLVIGAIAALVMSSQFLAQPFVWTSYPADEVLLAWLDILRDRALVSMALAASIIIVARIPMGSGLAANAVLALGVLSGAAAGEGLLIQLDSQRAASDMANFIAHTLQWSILAGCLLVLFSLWNAMLGAAEAGRQERQAEISLRQMATATQLAALKRQLDPHFIFNTLASIRRLSRVSTAEGGELMDDLLRYMRVTLARSAGESASLEEEIELVASYLRVCARRMDGRLKFEIQAPLELHGLDFPPLMLATLVENAVKHGIEPLLDGGEIRISATRVSNVLEVSVTDTGRGFQSSEGGGLGLANIRLRLRAKFGASATLDLVANVPRGVIARLRVPVSP